MPSLAAGATIIKLYAGQTARPARNQATRTGCRFSIRGVHRTIRRTLEITGLDRVLATDA
jgi:hypothetical protein